MPTTSNMICRRNLNINMLVFHSDFGKCPLHLYKKMFNVYHKSNKSPFRCSLNVAYRVLLNQQVD